MENDEIKNSFNNTYGLLMPKIDTGDILFGDFNLDRDKYHSPEEIIDEDKGEFERPDFSNWTCKVCEKLIEGSYFWYYLKHDTDEKESIVLCSKECLDKFIKSESCNNYEIYEYSRCTAYYKCEELNNIRGICENVENKTDQSITSIISSNHCEPAQAGSILATYKLTEVLTEFSKQTEQQYLLNIEMMKAGAKESAKQFLITTILTILVINLTIVSIVHTLLNW